MFAEIIPARRLPLRFNTLTYKIDHSLDDTLRIGQLVLIPFRSQKELGVVKTIYSDLKHLPPGELKTIDTIINDSPALSNEQIIFLEEIATLHRVSLGFLLRGFLFPSQKKYIKLFSEINKRHGEAVKPNSSPMFNTKLFIHDNPAQLSSYYKKYLSSTHQQLFIVSETSAIEPLIKKLQPYTSNQIIDLTSDITNSKLFEIWIRLWQKEPLVIVGTRRAFFLPWTDLSDIFIIDEADPLHKSWDMAPRFHNRDLAKSLGLLYKATLHLTGHSPSIETYYSIKKITLPSLPSLSNSVVSIVNTQEEKKAKNYEILSEQARSCLFKMDQEKKYSAFLFSHHRGVASYIACKQCGQINVCTKCQGSLTYHQKLKILWCHTCNFKEAFPRPCKRCGSFEIKSFKNGTEALEEEVVKLNLKNIPILRIDKDSDIPIIAPSLPAIIIGTQQAWRKINWDTIGLLVFTDSDTPLFIPEYKSSEQLWYYIRDAQFRLPKQSQFIIQTTQPHHSLFSSITSPTQYYEQELINRKEFDYPPFSYLVKLYVSSNSQEQAEHEAHLVYQNLARLTKKNFLSTIISSPRASIPAILHNKYWQIITVKLPPFSYKKVLPELLKCVPFTWKIDLNPQNILRF